MPGPSSLPLKPCLSKARYTSLAQHRLPNVRPLIGDGLGPTRKDAHQTFRIRKDGSLKELPLPPLLDPVVLEQRSRFEAPKKNQRFAEKTPFQKKLWQNPYAHTLASPIRLCRMLQISLPVALLTSLHPRPHPTTEDPWLVPLSLTTDETQLGPPFRFICRKPAVQQLSIKKAWEKLIDPRMIRKLGSDNTKRMVWREDMADLIRDLMRKRLADKLRWNFGLRGRLVPTDSPRTEDLENVKVREVSCVLAFDTLRTRADDIQDRCDEIAIELEKWSGYFSSYYGDRFDPHKLPSTTHRSPSWYTQPLISQIQPRIRFPELEFKTTIWRGKKVAVYSLFDLLGDVTAQQLIEGSEYEGQKYVIIPSAKHNVPVEILLMQLQAYLARPKPYI